MGAREGIITIATMMIVVTMAIMTMIIATDTNKRFLDDVCVNKGLRRFGAFFFGGWFS